MRGRHPVCEFSTGHIYTSVTSCVTVLVFDLCDTTCTFVCLNDTMCDVTGA